MSLDNVNLAVRIDALDYTRYIEKLEFQDAAVGGIQYITFNLSQKLPSYVPTMAAVYVYDTRTSECIASGILNDTGHHVNTTDGDVWQMTAFGPIQRLRDITWPYVAVDNQTSQGWVEYQAGANDTNTSRPAPLPGDNSGNTGILISAPSGTSITGGTGGTEPSVCYHRMAKAGDGGMYPARFAYTWVCGVATANDWCDGFVGNNPNPFWCSYPEGAQSNVHMSVTQTDYVTYYPGNAPNLISNNEFYPFVRLDAGTTITCGPKFWAWWGNFSIRALLYWSSGTWNTTQSAQYQTRATSYTYEIVRDVVVRFADHAFDTVNTFSVATSNYGVDLMAYDDGVTAEDVLNDLMALDPAYRYTTDAPNAFSNNKFRFTWAAWPSTVRYETTLEDGGDFPLSVTDVYDDVIVLYTDLNGEQQVYGPTGATQLNIDWNAGPMGQLASGGSGIVKLAKIDLGNELGSKANAQQAATNFLNDHKNPTNSGTITISRPIRDVLNGGFVQPWEIQAGELIRIRGIDVDAGGDALNASDSDGQSVFRVWTNTYNSDSNTATLELDSWSRTTANAISKVLQKRNRFR